MAFKLLNRASVLCDTLGTGALSLGAASEAKFQTFAEAGLEDGDTTLYVAEDGNEWETGLGTYTAVGAILARTTILESTNGGNAINLTGSAVVFCDVDASRLITLGLVRPALQANRTYYVRKDGSDSNDGLADTANGAFLTIGACMTALSQIDFNGFTVTVLVRAGTYAESVFVPACVGQRSISSLVIEGDTVSPGNVIVQGQTAFAGCFNANSGNIAFSIRGFELQGGVANAYGLYANNGGAITMNGAMEFGAFTGAFSAHIYADRLGIIGLGNTACTVSGGVGTLIKARDAGVISNFGTPTWTLTGTPAWGTAGVDSDRVGAITLSIIFSGAATGKRYQVSINGTIQTFGSGATYIPGDVAGTTATGGIYN